VAASREVCGNIGFEKFGITEILPQHALDVQHAS